MEMIAEGVETKEQVELLASWGCKTVQGFYFGKPMSADEIGHVLRREKDIACTAKQRPDAYRPSPASLVLTCY
jgi:sensor c-di-GMP phosphodiesterase-like protein